MTVMAHLRFLLFLAVLPVTSILAHLVLLPIEPLPVEAAIALGFDIAALVYLSTVASVWW